MVRSCQARTRQPCLISIVLRQSRSVRISDYFIKVIFNYKMRTWKLPLLVIKFGSQLFIWILLQTIIRQVTGFRDLSIPGRAF